MNQRNNEEYKLEDDARYRRIDREELADGLREGCYDVLSNPAFSPVRSFLILFDFFAGTTKNISGAR